VHEADHVAPSSAKVKNEWSYTSASLMHRVDFTLSPAHTNFHNALDLSPVIIL